MIAEKIKSQQKDCLKRLKELQKQVTQELNNYKRLEYEKKKIPKYIKKDNAWYRETAEYYKDELRRNATNAEKKLHLILRRSRFREDFTFQDIVYIYNKSRIVKFYIADFVIISKKLVIELDGDYHNAPEQWSKDIERTKELEKLGYKVIRIPNRMMDTEAGRMQVFKKIEEIYDSI